MTEPTPEQITAYEEGRAAFAEGVASTDVPYPDGTDRFLLWLRGYVQARAAATYPTR